MDAHFLAPQPTPLSAPFWEGTRTGELRLQQCDDCGGWRWTPQILCTHCYSPHFGWEAASGRGKIYSFTTVHRPPVPTFIAPYVVAVVELDEGPLMLTRIVDVSPETVAIDMRVKVKLTPLDETITLYPFTAD
ncbi:MAG: Zn-ribbon domain-containing OB-fold protein [Sphingopyxis sp.]|nr:Zn-ribbon domain-containing OB-fold protein [Sphingopyxis sp.]